MKNLTAGVFYCNLLVLLGIIIAYSLNIILIIDAINYLLLSFGFLMFFFVLFLQVLAGKGLFKIFTLMLAATGTLIWTMGLMDIISYEKTWDIAFLLIISSFILSIYTYVTKHSSAIFKAILGFTVLMLLSTIFFTSKSLFDNQILLLSNLAIFSVIALFAFIFPERTSNN